MHPLIESMIEWPSYPHPDSWATLEEFKLQMKEHDKEWKKWKEKWGYLYPDMP